LIVSGLLIGLHSCPSNQSFVWLCLCVYIFPLQKWFASLPSYESIVFLILRMRLSPPRCLAGLRPRPTIRELLRRLSLFIGGAVLAYLFVYLVWFTPLLVYILDYLYLQPLPNIICNRCNNFTYQYPVENSNFCSPVKREQWENEADRVEEGVFLLILVATYHPNMNARQAIRASWGNVTVYRSQRIKTLFMFGWHEDKNYNYQVCF